MTRIRLGNMARFLGACGGLTLGRNAWILGRETEQLMLSAGCQTRGIAKGERLSILAWYGQSEKNSGSLDRRIDHLRANCTSSQ